MRPTVYLTSNVFFELISNEKLDREIRKKIQTLIKKLETISRLNYYDGRFPSKDNLKDDIKNLNPDFLGCHLSHNISSDLLDKSNVVAISTSTAGYNHIQRSNRDDILISHTPDVLYETVADYTISLIMASLRNIVDLHNQVWNGEWNPEDKWDLDQNLSSVINKKVIGIVGMGEIGTELMKRLYPWNLRILYHTLNRKEELEKEYSKLEYKESLTTIFEECDIISLHVPLNKHTHNLVNRDLLKLMKTDALLVNTARGSILDMEVLLDLLEKREISINIALDVYPVEPIERKTLERLKAIKKEQPSIRMILMPHNASADADTRGKMAVIFLENIIKFIESNKLEDLKTIALIPEHRAKINQLDWKITKYWDRKVKN